MSGPQLTAALHSSWEAENRDEPLALGVGVAYDGDCSRSREGDDVVITLTDCVAATSQEEHDNAIAYD